MAVAWAYGLELFFQLSGADPFIYTGYSTSAGDLISRWGYPYYAVRFGLILPSTLVYDLLGARIGYLTLRWVLVVVATGSVFLLHLRRFRWQSGVVAVAAILLNPTFVRAVLTMYSTTVGVPALAAAGALLLLPGSPRLRMGIRLGAGLLIGLAVHSNLFTLLPAGALIVVWSCCRAFVDRRDAAFGLLPLASGVAGVTLCGFIYYGQQFGDPNLLSPSLAAANRLSSAPSPDKEPTLDWLNFRPEIWLPIVATAVLAVVLLRARRKPEWYEWALAVLPAAMWCAYAVHTFVLGSNALELYFYSAYMIGPTLMALSAAVGVLAESWSERLGGLLWPMAAALVLFVPVLWARFGRGIVIWALNGVLPLTLLALAAVWIARRSAVAAACAVAIITVFPFSVTLGAPRGVPLLPGQPWRQEPHYDAALFRYDDVSLDLYSLAARFSSAMAHAGHQVGSRVFWVPSDDYGAVLMQWTYLGPFSTITPPSAAPMPQLDPATVERLNARTPRYLVVLASTMERRDDGVRAIKSLGLPIRHESSSLYQEGPYRLFVSEFELEPDVCDLEYMGEPLFWSSLPVCVPS